MKYLSKYILPAVFVVAVFLVAYPQRTRPELVVEPVWATSAERATVDGEQDEEGRGLIPVAFGDGFAYLTRDGRVAYRGRTAAHVALSPDAFVNYSRTSAQLVVQHVNGEFRASIPITGYPVFIGDRLFVVGDGGGTISEWSIDGDELWRIDIAAPLVSIGASSGYLGLGLGGGGPRIVLPDGTLTELSPAEAGEAPIVHSIGVSDAPARLAVVAGTESSDRGDAAGDTVPLDLSVYDLESSTAERIVHRRIRASFDAPPLLHLLSDGRLVVSSASDGPAIVTFDPVGSDEHLIPLQFPGRYVSEIDGLPLEAVLSVSPIADPSQGFAFPAELVLVARGGRVPARTSWAAGTTAIARHGSMLTIQVDDRVLAMRLGVR